jgi:eukaryotic-like serine/threonine-protein kinase
MAPAMPATTPSTIGPYRVDRELGRGGMGIVFLAHDTRLDRPVALKALPEEFASDPERLARFEREARVLAQLHHPNVASIYGLEEAGGRRYLALEYVDGETLADRLARGPLPLHDTLALCAQIAAGVEAAHEAGVVHRDLKPGNVVIATDDTAKILDFGLAKGRVAEPGQSPTLANSPTFAQSPTLINSPTIQSPATIPGVILGTASYLSPEQARGKAVDRRTDIWSFGCVLYECLTGTRAFEGETVSDTIAKILERDLDLSPLPERTPPAVRGLLARCLEKDPKRRLRDIGDARLTLEEVRSGRDPGSSGLIGAAGAAGTAGAAGGAALPASGAMRPHGIRLPRPSLIAAALVGFFVAAALWNVMGRRAGDGARSVANLSVMVPDDLRLRTANLSPDGRVLVMLATPKPTPGEPEPRNRIYIRRMDRQAFEPLRGTEDVQAYALSPDARSIAVLAPISQKAAKLRLLRAPLDGSSPPVPICDWDDSWGGSMAWLESGDLLIAAGGGREYVRLAPGGTAGKPQRLDVPGVTATFTFNRVLPGDRGVFLSATSYEGNVFRQGIAVLDLKTMKVKMLIRDGGSPRFMPPDHLLFTRGASLLAVPFDLGRLETRGEPVGVMDGLRVDQSWFNAFVDYRPSGSLLYTPGGDVSRGRHAVVFGARGGRTEWSAERQPFEAQMSASRDGGRFAAIIANADAIYEIWISERGQPISRRAIATPGADCAGPVWSPDGRQIAYTQMSRTASDGIYVADADGGGAPQRVFAATSPDTNWIPTSWSPDGSQILLTKGVQGQGSTWVLDLPKEAGSAARMRPVFVGPGRRVQAAFSPDGHLIGYLSDETGTFEAFVRGWGPNGPEERAVIASIGGAQSFAWGPGGKSFYYRTPQGKLKAVSITREPRLSVGSPTAIWDLDSLRVVQGMFEILPDGNLLAIEKGEGEESVKRIDLVLHFDEQLKASLKRR